MKDPTSGGAWAGVVKERPDGNMNRPDNETKTTNRELNMPKAPLRINIPTKPDKLIELAQAILLKNGDLGANSPLKTLRISDFQNLTVTADTKNKLSKNLYKQAERATEERDIALGHDGPLSANTVRFFVASARDLLSGIYKGNEQALGDWGFEVDTSPRPSAAKAKKGTPS